MLYFAKTKLQPDLLDLTSDQITDKAVPFLKKSIRNKNFKLENLSLVSRNISTANRTAIQDLLEARRRDYIIP